MKRAFIVGGVNYTPAQFNEYRRSLHSAMTHRFCNIPSRVGSVTTDWTFEDLVRKDVSLLAWCDELHLFPNWQADPYSVVMRNIALTIPGITIVHVDKVPTVNGEV